MNWKNRFRSMVMIIFPVCLVYDISFSQILFGPAPKDGDIVHAFEGYLIVNTLAVVIAWAILPWTIFDAVAKKPEPAPVPMPNLEDVSGQETLEDYLEKRREIKKDGRTS